MEDVTMYVCPEMSCSRRVVDGIECPHAAPHELNKFCKEGCTFLSDKYKYKKPCVQVTEAIKANYEQIVS